MDLDLFVKQFYQIDIYNASECQNNITSNSIFICSTDDYPEVLKAECSKHEIPTDSEEYNNFGFTNKISLKPVISSKLDGKTVFDYPKTMEINCKIVYNVGVANQSSPEWKYPGNVLVNVVQKYDVYFDQESNRISTRELNPLDQLN